MQGVTEDPADVGTISREIRDMRLLQCKARGSMEHGRYSSRIDWIPSRTTSKITRQNVNEILDSAGNRGQRKIKLGKSGRASSFSVTAEALDGRITIITGRKESGKSHLAKMLVRGLAGARGLLHHLRPQRRVWLDRAEGRRQRRRTIAEKVDVRKPARDLKFSLAGAGCASVTSLLQHSLEMPGTSMREFMRIWEGMEAKHELSLDVARRHTSSSGAATSSSATRSTARYYHPLRTRGSSADSGPGVHGLDEFFKTHPDGGALVDLAQQGLPAKQEDDRRAHPLEARGASGAEDRFRRSSSSPRRRTSTSGRPTGRTSSPG